MSRRQKEFFWQDWLVTQKYNQESVFLFYSVSDMIGDHEVLISQLHAARLFRESRIPFLWHPNKHGVPVHSCSFKKIIISKTIRIKIEHGHLTQCDAQGSLVELKREPCDATLDLK